VLQQYGVQAIGVSGESFNPGIHEAIGVVNQAGQKAGTILAVAEKGYMLNDKLLRPAKVLVVAEQ
jgi:molecular chaperone GrpE